MESNGKLVVHCGGRRKSREELAGLETPNSTATWRPVPHHALVERLLQGLADEGLAVVREDYATAGRSDSRLFGVMDLRIPTQDAEGVGMALGLRAANDKSMSIQVIAAARVFVCDNLAFSGTDGSVVLKKRHTSGLDLAAEIPGAIDQFLERAGAFRVDIDRMRNFALSNGRAKALLHDAFASRHAVLPIRLFPVVSRLYFGDPEQRDKFADRTLWSLNNAFTEAVKRLRAVPQHKAGQRIGRFFGRLVHTN